MDLANGGNAPNGGAVHAGKEKTGRRKKVGFVDRKGGSMPTNHRQQQEESEAPKQGAEAEAEKNTSRPNGLPEKAQGSGKEVDLADIARDLNKIKRQNTITHVLLGTVIVMTAVWQVNEMSFLLWVQRKLSNPFKSLGDLIKGSLKLKGRRPAVIESSPLPPVGIPDVTRADLPTFVISGEHR